MKLKPMIWSDYKAMNGQNVVLCTTVVGLACIEIVKGVGYHAKLGAYSLGAYKDIEDAKKVIADKVLDLLQGAIEPQVTTFGELEDGESFMLYVPWQKTLEDGEGNATNPQIQSVSVKLSTHETVVRL